MPDPAPSSSLPSALRGTPPTGGPEASTPGERPGLPKPVSKWAIHRRMYDWTLALADRKHATWALAFISFSESIWFPIPPDVLQVALTLARPRRAMWYALVNSVSNIAGGVAGYGIGFFARSAVAGLFGEHAFDALAPYTSNLWLLTAGALAVHPYKIFTIGAGFLEVDLATYVAASAIGRAPRFFIIAVLLYYFGEPAKRFIDKYFNLLTITFTVLLVAFVVVLGMLRKHPKPAEPSLTPEIKAPLTTKP